MIFPFEMPRYSQSSQIWSRQIFFQKTASEKYQLFHNASNHVCSPAKPFFESKKWWKNEANDYLLEASFSQSLSFSSDIWTIQKSIFSRMYEWQ